MARRLGRGGAPRALMAVVCLAGAGPEIGSYRDGFETEQPTWRREESDITARLLGHERSEQARHGGQRSERFAFASEGPGSSFFYSLPLPKIPLAEDLEVSLYARSNQPGVQLLVRLVLPGDTDPETGQPSFLLVQGTASDDADRWERLEIADLPRAAEAQARILRIKTGRKISLDGAYLERLVVNLYGGPGETEVFLDDLSISPVPVELADAEAEGAEAPSQPTPALDAPPAGAPAPGAPTGAGIEIQFGRLMRNGHDWFPSMLSAPGADLAVALPFGFDVIEVDPGADPAKLQAAAASGALLMPDLGRAATAQDALDQAAAFPVPDAVAFWELGASLGGSVDPALRKTELERVRQVLLGLHERPAGRPRLATAIVSGDFARYASPGRGLDLMGVDLASWGTSREPGSQLQYLLQRRQLTALWDVRLPHWAWIDAAPRRGVTQAIWGDDLPPAWGPPRVQPEQVRVATFLALMSGYKGVGFRADAELSRPAGRAVLYEMGLLNAEIDLVESILSRGVDPIAALPTFMPDPQKIITFNTSGISGQITGRSTNSQNKPQPEASPHPTIRAASIAARDNRARLLVLADISDGSQFQPPQMALNDLKMRVPSAPDSAQVLEISLGGCEWLVRERVPGGVQFTIPEFGVSTLVLMTTDLALADRVRRAVESIRPQAVDLAVKQARLQYDWVAEIHARLVNDGHPILRDDKPTTDAEDLLAQSGRMIRSAEEARAREDYPLAWNEARRAGRPLRLLMRQHWDQAFRALAYASGVPRPETIKPNGPKPPRILVPPTASAPLVAFNTLPQHYIWTDWIAEAQWSANLLPGGTFDDVAPDDLARAGWLDVGRRDDRTAGLVRLEPDPKQGMVLKLSVDPTDPKEIDRLAPFLDQPVAAVRTPPIEVEARQLLRIRVRVRLPRRLPPGAGGVIIRDSLGGEALQFRQTDGIPDWTEVILYRRAPADGPFRLTLGLAGFGAAYFDDVRIERVERIDGLPTSGGELAERPRPRSRAVPRLPSAALPNRHGAGSRTVR